MSTPTFEPRFFTAGETLIWKKALSDYTPAGGWTLTYYFRAQNGIGFDATAANDNGTFKITVPTASTSPLAPGAIGWQAWAEKDGEKFLVDSGEAIVKAGFATVGANQTVDSRSKNKQILDAIDATIQNRATIDQSRYTIGNRSLDRIPAVELLEWRKYYSQLVSQEIAREKQRQGAPYLKTIKTRFNQPS